MPSQPPSSRPSPASSPATDGVLSEFSNDADMRELIEMFVGEMPERVRSLESLWRTRELEPLKRLAHQLKGAGGGYGFSPVSSAAGQLETTLNAALLAATTGRLDDVSLDRIQSEVNSLIQVCRRVRAAD
jgi:HPt (histidine-containing phosphotransfer) domain-containing protein